MTQKINQHQGLRKKLEEATEASSEAEYLARLDAATREFPNAVARLRSPYKIERYTCFMHVFGFTENPEYTAIAKRGFSVVYAGPAFAQWVLDKELFVEVPEHEARDGDFVFYSDEHDKIRHAGLYLGSQRVESKWGKGYLFQHGILEVPESYGSKARFYRKISYQRVLDAFKDFAREKGMLFD